MPDRDITIDMRIRLQGSFESAWAGWGNIGLSFSSQESKITNLTIGEQSYPLPQNVQPGDLHEYRLIKSGNQVTLYINGDYNRTASGPNLISGNLSIGGICPKTSCSNSVFMEIDSIRIYE